MLNNKDIVVMPGPKVGKLKISDMFQADLEQTIGTSSDNLTGDDELVNMQKSMFEEAISGIHSGPGEALAAQLGELLGKPVQHAALAAPSSSATTQPVVPYCPEQVPRSRQRAATHLRQATAVAWGWAWASSTLVYGEGQAASHDANQKSAQRQPQQQDDPKTPMKKAGRADPGGQQSASKAQGPDGTRTQVKHK